MRLEIAEVLESLYRGEAMSAQDVGRDRCDGKRVAVDEQKMVGWRGLFEYQPCEMVEFFCVRTGHFGRIVETAPMFVGDNAVQ